MATAGDEHYGFGKNWADYVDRAFSDDRLEIAQSRLLTFLGLDSLEGMSFLDIGCGSGIHSLAAWHAGADTVHSFDYDADSVATTSRLRAGAGSPTNWTVEQGSVLDREYMNALPKADVVYSWGVLHHTGQMWKAVGHAALPMHERSVFYIALYCSDVYVKRSPEHWLRVKRRYNRAGPAGKRLMEYRHMTRQLLGSALRGKNPLRYVREYRHMRGMDYRTDVRDWLGGWPMEFAGLAETKAFCRERLNLELINILAGEACTEYLFRTSGARNYWDAHLQSLPELKPLPRPYDHVEGHCYRARIADETGQDLSAPPMRSQIMLYEDGVPVGFGHAIHEHIRRHGMGRYSHENGEILFAATDNSDPRVNGRQYMYRNMHRDG